MKPRRFAVIGDPVAHSRSPAMHGAAFRALGLAHTYEAVRVTAEELPAFVARLRGGEFDGVNVTVPHKQRVLALVDAVDASARACGAANALVRDAAGKIVAYNTDAPALAEEVRALLGSAPRPTIRALILGSGGAARAARAALEGDLGVTDVAVRARTPIDETTQPWKPSPASEAKTQIVVQATSAGMKGADPGERAAEAVAWDALPSDAVALDVVYAPAGYAFLACGACARRAVRQRPRHARAARDPRAAPLARRVRTPGGNAFCPRARSLNLQAARPTPPAPGTLSPGLGQKLLGKKRQLGYTRIVQLLVYLVIVPTVLLLLVGIVLVFVGSPLNILFGILTVSFVLVVVTGVVLVLVFLRREANLSQLQSDFVSKVSHELRTPLTSIRLFVETMGRARSDQATQDMCIGALDRETDRLTQIIERLLDWGRMEAGRKQYELLDENVSTVIDEAVGAFDPQQHRHPDLQFTVSVEPGLPRVHVDRAAMVDALGNLLSNALKYGGTPPIVKLHAFALPGGVAIEVNDNGDGIPRVEHRRIFEKFYRIDHRLSREREGSGLGLAIVKHIVRAHRGRIQLDSSKGRGSTFRIVLPALAPVLATSVVETRADSSSESKGV